MERTREPALIDRARERSTLQTLLEGAHEGRGAALVIRGEAGIGKTAMLRFAEAHAPGFQVAHVAGVQAEMELPLAGVHHLCAPMLGGLDALPRPQQDAMRVALGLAAGDPPDQFLVALAVLSLVSAAAEAGPMLCLVDDAQWLDAASAQTLSFVARRLLAERILILVAVREPTGPGPFDNLPEMRLQGLEGPDARALLTTAVAGRLDARLRDRIIDETRGNPLALLELPPRMSPAELAGGFGLRSADDLPRHIEDSYLRRIGELPEATQRLLLLASAEPVGDATLLWRAAERFGVRASDAAPAQQAELFEVGARVSFRHPLVRSAVYQGAASSDRRLAHQALAEVCDPEAEADRRAWHRALAAAGPDEDVAGELERSAGRAQARGGLAAAAAFLTRAVTLTPDPARRANRALDAAQANVLAGAFEVALGLLAVAEAARLDEFGRARVDLLRAQLAFASSRGTEATPLLLAAARRLEPLDAALARETYADAFSAALFGARLNSDVGVSDVARAARAAARPESEPAPADLLLDALAALDADYATAVAPSRAALRKLTDAGTTPRDRLRWLWLGSVVALEMWDDDAAYALSDHGVRVARETGTLTELALALSAYAPVLVFCGDLAAASAAVTETHLVEEATRISSAPYGALILGAWQGRPETRTLIETTVGEARSRSEGVGVAICDYVRAVLCNGACEYEEALAAALSASGHGEVVVENWGLSELVEPAVRLGRNDVADEAVARLTAKARATGTGWALGIEARSRALLAGGAGAEELFDRAVTHLASSRMRAEQARTHLLFGEWLRGEGRGADARPHLRVAHGMFDEMGMQAFAERARSALAEAGERVHGRPSATPDGMTPQERQIAHLAREGLTNPQIAARLFLSPRTVEWHLRKVFVKLGIRSRRELPAALVPSGT
jgi:DNA-binding CsgD family transcriptional regulator